MRKVLFAMTGTAHCQRQVAFFLILPDNPPPSTMINGSTLRVYQCETSILSDMKEHGLFSRLSAGGGHANFKRSPIFAQKQVISVHCNKLFV